MPQFITPTEAARALKVSTRTIYEHLRSGRLPALKIGSLWRIDAKALYISTAASHEDGRDA